MNNSNNSIATIFALIACVVAVLALLIGFGNHVAPKNYGGVTNYDEVDSTALKIGGTNGTRVGPIITGTCTPIVGAGTVAASSTAAFDCAVTGVVSGDYVQTQIATSSALLSTGTWEIVASAASSTSGFITEIWRNQTGAAANPSALSAASSTAYTVFHPVSSVPGL